MGKSLKSVGNHRGEANPRRTPSALTAAALTQRFFLVLKRGCDNCFT